MTEYNKRLYGDTVSIKLRVNKLSYGEGVVGFAPSVQVPSHPSKRKFEVGYGIPKMVGCYYGSSKYGNLGPGCIVIIKFDFKKEEVRILLNGECVTKDAVWEGSKRRRCREFWSDPIIPIDFNDTDVIQDVIPTPPGQIKEIREIETYTYRMILCTS